MVGPIKNKIEMCVIAHTTLRQILRALSEETIAEILELRAAYVNFKRIEGDPELKPNDTVRVHLTPRRFPVSQTNWNDRILNETEDYVVVNKPYGVPVHPTCDNATENVIFQLEKALKRKLWIVHRLDFETAGVMVLAKNRAFANTFRLQLQSRELEKLYACSVETPVVPGEYIHYIHTDGLAPYLCSRNETLGSKLCELAVLRCEKNPATKLYDVLISLKTGRHHQIRSQLAFLGSPIAGDTVYGSTYPTQDFLLTHIRLAKKGTSVVYGNIDHTPCGTPSIHLQ